MTYHKSFSDYVYVKRITESSSSDQIKQTVDRNPCLWIKQVKETSTGPSFDIVHLTECLNSLNTSIIASHERIYRSSLTGEPYFPVPWFVIAEDCEFLNSLIDLIPTGLGDSGLQQVAMMLLTNLCIFSEVKGKFNNSWNYRLFIERGNYVPAVSSPNKETSSTHNSNCQPEPPIFEILSLNNSFLYNNLNTKLQEKVNALKNLINYAAGPLIFLLNVTDLNQLTIWATYSLRGLVKSSLDYDLLSVPSSEQWTNYLLLIPHLVQALYTAFQPEFFKPIPRFTNEFTNTMKKLAQFISEDLVNLELIVNLLHLFNWVSKTPSYNLFCSPLEFQSEYHKLEQLFHNALPNLLNAISYIWLCPSCQKRNLWYNISSINMCSSICSTDCTDFEFQLFDWTSEVLVQLFRLTSNPSLNQWLQGEYNLIEASLNLAFVFVVCRNSLCPSSISKCVIYSLRVTGQCSDNTSTDNTLVADRLLNLLAFLIIWLHQRCDPRICGPESNWTMANMVQYFSVSILDVSDQYVTLLDRCIYPNLGSELGSQESTRLLLSCYYSGKRTQSASQMWQSILVRIDQELRIQLPFWKYYGQKLPSSYRQTIMNIFRLIRLIVNQNDAEIFIGDLNSYIQTCPILNLLHSTLLGKEDHFESFMESVSF